MLFRLTFSVKQFKIKYRLCQNVERVMEMFSEELRILDRNTVRYMIDEMQVELKDANTQLENANAQLESANAKLQEKKQEIEQLKKRIAELENQTKK